MHHRILAALRSLRQDLAARLDEAAVHDACRRAEHRSVPEIHAELARRGVAICVRRCAL